MTGSLLSTSRGPMGGRIAWLPRDSFRLPSYSNLDMRLSKQFAIHERYRFEFRAETFNLLNTTIIQAVNQNAYTSAAAGSSASCPALSGGAKFINPVTGHTNTCMVPVTAFQSPTTTSAFLLGARQMQFGFRFEF